MCVCFWVSWEAEANYGYRVDRHNAVYGARIEDLKEVLGPLHSYQKRQGDTVNATESYLVDVRRLHKYEKV